MLFKVHQFRLLCSIGLLALMLVSDLRAQYTADLVQPAPSASDTIKARKLIEQAQEYYAIEAYQKSVECLHQAELLTKPLRISRMSVVIDRNMFAAYLELGKLDSAAIYADLLLEEARKIKNAEAEMDAWNSKAMLYSSNLFLDSALHAYQRACDLAMTLNNQNALATFSSNMGIIFGQQRQYEKAIDYFRRAYDIGREINDSILITLGSLNIGRGYTEGATFDSAAYYLNIAEETARRMIANEPSMYNSVLNFKALLHLHQGNYEQAEVQFQELVEIYSNNQQHTYLAEVYGRLAQIALKTEDYRQAVQYGRMNLDLVKDLPAEEAREKALLVLTQAYGRLQDYEEAYKFGEQYRQLRDSSYGEEVTRLVAEMESKYELEKKNAENYELSLEAQRQTLLARRRTNIALVAGLITLLILAVLFYFNQEYRHKKQLNLQLEATVRERTTELETTNEELKKYIEELRTFGYITSHDLKEPLRNISGFSSLLEKRFGQMLDTESREFLDYIKRNTRQMHEMIEDIMIYSTVSDQPTVRKVVDINRVAAKVEGHLKILITACDGNLRYQDLPVITSNESQLFMVLKNLIENGFRYNRSASPEVNLRYERAGALHHFYIEDNGIGIPEEYQDQIFLPFKRLHNRSEFSGTGMGLSIGKKIAVRMGGDLQVQRSTKSGSVFVFTLPVRATSGL